MSDDLGIDGAAAGIDPVTALKMVIGGEPIAPGDRTEPDQMLARVKALPLPGAEGSNPWEGSRTLEDMTDEEADAAYSDTALIITRGLLHIHDQQAFDHFDEAFLWEKFKDHYADWIADVGPSGFQAGYAMNLFRSFVGVPTQGNPAVLG